MKISLNKLNRYEVQGIKDPGTAKTGIAGYKCKFIGFLAKLFCKAVSVKTEAGTVYLNRKSFIHWYKRLDLNQDEKKLEKASRDSKFVQQASG